jgi:hypothetical protein
MDKMEFVNISTVRNDSMNLLDLVLIPIVRGRPATRRREYYMRQGAMAFQWLHRIPATHSIGVDHKPLMVVQTKVAGTPLPFCDKCNKLMPSLAHLETHKAVYCDLVECEHCPPNHNRKYATPWEVTLHKICTMLCPIPTCNKQFNRVEHFITHARQCALAYKGIEVNQRGLKWILSRVFIVHFPFGFTLKIYSIF